MQESTQRIIQVILYLIIILGIYGVISWIFLRSDFLIALGLALFITGVIMLPIWYVLPGTIKFKLGIKLFHPHAPGSNFQLSQWLALWGFVVAIGSIILAIKPYL